MARDNRKVNLDAMLPRGDLLGVARPVRGPNQTIRIMDFEAGAQYGLLRKPDFQRETANWSPEQVASLIKTFANEDIIPAVILWQNGQHLFVVDGAHRMSALVAWVRDDYGAGDLSLNAAKGEVPAAQRAFHEETKRLVAETVGPWATFKTESPVFQMKELVVQWIENHDPSNVAEAFIRINQGGTQIDHLEVRILRAPRSALSIATRAITRGGTGNEYWAHFTDAKARSETPKLGRQIYDLLFKPALATPTRTVEVPLAGAEYGAHVVRFAFDLVVLANNLQIPDSSRKPIITEKDTLPEDLDGIQTLNYLKRVKRAVEQILSTQPASLGMHPALYFYTAGGTFQSASLLNIMAWINDLEKRHKLDTFRAVRGAFEDLVLAHPVVVKPATHKLGSGSRTRSKMFSLFNRAVDLLDEDRDIPKAWASLKEEFKHLEGDEADEREAEESGLPFAKFSTGAKNAATMMDLATVARCEICRGLMHPNGKALDHKQKRADGGTSARANSRYIHPRCGSERDKDEKAVTPSA